MVQKDIPLPDLGKQVGSALDLGRSTSGGGCAGQGGMGLGGAGLKFGRAAEKLGDTGNKGRIFQIRPVNQVVNPHQAVQVHRTGNLEQIILFKTELVHEATISGVNNPSPPGARLPHSDGITGFPR